MPQLDRGNVRQEVACRSQSDGIEDVFILVKSCQDQDPDVGESGVVDDPGRRVQPVHDRHADVHQHHIGNVHPDLLELQWRRWRPLQLR